MGNLDSVIELKAKIKAIKPKPSGSYDDTQIQNDIADLQDQVNNISVGGYDDTEIKNRVEALENKPDSDTIYDDTVLTQRVETLENKPDSDTIYDDSALVARVEVLEDKKSASLSVATMSNTGGTEIQSTISQETNSILFNYQKNTKNELPNYLNAQINSDNFSLATTAYVDNNTVRAMFDQEYQYLRIVGKNENIDLGFNKESDDTLRIQEYAKDDRGQTQKIYDMQLPNKEYVDSAVNSAKMRRTVVGEERLIGEFVWDGVAYDHYEKIIDFGALPNSAQKTAAHGIAEPKTIIKIYGEAQNSSNNLAIPFISADGSLFTYLGVGKNNITIGTNSDRSSFNALIYIEYIKPRA